MEGGGIFTGIDNEFSLSELEGVDCIIPYINSDDGKTYVFGWFDDIIEKNGHIFYGGGSLTRTTIHENEEKRIADGACRNLEYKDGWLYFTKNQQLCRIRLDGSDETLVYEDHVTHYYVDGDSGIYILSFELGVLTISFMSFETSKTEIVLKTEINTGRKVSIIGIIDDVLYISRSPLSEKIEIMKIEHGELVSIHRVLEKADVEYDRPFINGRYIYYATIEGMHKYNPITDEDRLVAESNYGFGEIYVN